MNGELSVKVYPIRLIILKENINKENKEKKSVAVTLSHTKLTTMTSPPQKKQTNKQTKTKTKKKKVGVKKNP